MIPFLLFNSSTWLQIQQSDIDALSKLQNLFLSTLLQVQKAPTFYLHWELGVTLIPLRILKEKLLLYHHISCLPEKLLSLKILKIQEKLKLPSLRGEVESFLNEFEIVDVTAFSKHIWKKYVSEKIAQKNKILLLEMAKKLKKVDYLSKACEEFGLQDYFSNLSLDLARTKFREVTKCMQTCRSHASSDSSNIYAMHRCYDCSSQDSLNHWWFCEAYKHLRTNKNKESDRDICEFYQAVINQRLQQH